MGGSTSQVSWKSRAPEDDLLSALRNSGATMSELSSQAFDPKTSTIAGIRDHKLSILRVVADGWSSVILSLNSDLADPLAVSLSQGRDQAVVVFREYDQVAWGLTIYERGEDVASFWSDPETVDLDPGEAEVDATAVARAIGVSAAVIAPYLRHESAREGGKAYDDDQFELDDHWVRVDFMKRCGIDYPEPGSAGCRHVLILEGKPESAAPSNSAAPQPKVSFWRRLWR